MPEIITPPESVRLIELERVIEKGKTTFVEVGNALAEIRDSRIYRSSHGTFEDYCRERWGWSNRYVNMHIASAEVATNLAASGTIVPVTESQARPLAKLPAEHQPAAWEKAQEMAKEEGKPVTAKHVQAAVEEVFPTPHHGALSDAAISKGEEAAKDSEKLWLLKSTWKAATKKDRALFAEWINKN